MGPGRLQILKTDGGCRINAVTGGAANGSPERCALGDLGGRNFHRGGQWIDRTTLAHQEVDQVFDRQLLVCWLKSVEKVGHPEAEFPAMGPDQSPDRVWRASGANASVAEDLRCSAHSKPANGIWARGMAGGAG